MADEALSGKPSETGPAGGIARLAERLRAISRDVHVLTVLAGVLAVLSDQNFILESTVEAGHRGVVNACSDRTLRDALLGELVRVKAVGLAEGHAHARVEDIAGTRGRAGVIKGVEEHRCEAGRAASTARSGARLAGRVAGVASVRDCILVIADDRAGDNAARRSLEVDSGLAGGALRIEGPVAALAFSIAGQARDLLQVVQGLVVARDAARQALATLEHERWDTCEALRRESSAAGVA